MIMKRDVFEIEEISIIPDGEIGSSIIVGGSDPIGLDYSLGSLYLRSNGEIWRKSGPLNTDWSIIGDKNLNGGQANISDSQIQVRKDVASTWITVNPVLSAGEMGLESDTFKLKIGNGTDTWNNLPYISGPSISGKTFNQGVPSAVWVINHDLGKYPSIKTFDSANDEIEGKIEYTSLNTVTVTFSGQCSGITYLA
jgi:hypothetical protein